MAFDYIPFSVAITDPGGDNKQIPVLRAPSDIHGGGLTILEAYAVSSEDEANSLGVGGTTFTLALHRYSNAGTPAVNGTVAAAVGGTAEGWSAGVPNAFSVDSDYAFLDAGESLVLDYQEIQSGDPTGVVTVFGVAVRGR